MRKAASDEVDDLRRGGLLPGGLDGLKEQPVDITQDACYVSRPPTRPISPPMHPPPSKKVMVTIAVVLS